MRKVSPRGGGEGRGEGGERGGGASQHVSSRQLEPQLANLATINLFFHTDATTGRVGGRKQRHYVWRHEDGGWGGGAGH